MLFILTYTLTHMIESAQTACKEGKCVLATAFLDRLLFRSEVVSFSGTSYRINHRKTIFKAAD
ncbi:MAG: ATP-binding protein [Chryseolinea sp.]